VDGPEFWAALREDLAVAEREVFAQTLTFEADRAGRGFADALIASGAPDRRLLVDTHSRFIVSDKLVINPRHLFDRELRREVRETARTVAELQRRGVPVRYTNPLGPLFVRFPARNHKKLVVIDGRAAYLGGINFSDHNFAWHDVMLRFDEPGVVSHLRRDFLATWEGRNLASSRAFGRNEIHLFDGGASNPGRFGLILDRLQAARDRVTVICGYLTSPFCERLARVAARGVPVRLVLPARSNWPLSHEHALWEASRAGIEVRLDGGPMIHMKAVVVDDQALIVGSANLDLWSYWFQQEVVAVVTDAALVEEFRRRVLEPALARSRPWDRRIAPWRGRLRSFQMKLLQAGSRLLNPRPRRTAGESVMISEWEPNA
jgi:cardiolipin synthase